MSTPGTTDVDVVVVGAGISGLATAFDLQRRGAAVDVLDAATRAGGVIGTTHRDGALVESGPNSALDTTPLINELRDALGIRSDRAEANAVAGTRYVVRSGKLPGLFATRTGIAGEELSGPLQRRRNLFGEPLALLSKMGNQTI
jgi:phytoene dehydrogenase-like protein